MRQLYFLVMITNLSNRNQRQHSGHGRSCCRDFKGNERIVGLQTEGVSFHKILIKEFFVFLRHPVAATMWANAGHDLVSINFQG